MVAQNGTWLIKSRDGDATTSNVSPKTPNDAVKKPDASGKSTNALEVRVGADKIDFVVNGTVVHSEPKSGATAKTDGIYGIRINHLLEVQVDGFGGLEVAVTPSGAVPRLQSVASGGMLGRAARPAPNHDGPLAKTVSESARRRPQHTGTV